MNGLAWAQFGNHRCMPKPQQPELARNRRNQADHDGAELKAQEREPVDESGLEKAPGPVPQGNRPGHRPEKDQDKPTS